ncbi:MAG: ribosome silencing factor [Nitrospirales bacterium]|nr:ribosome silencing factor [Nitrospirales bacterium]
MICTVLDLKEKALAIARVAVEKNALDVLILEVGALTSIADYFVLCSGNSERQVKAIAETIDQELSHRFSAHATIEGGSSGTWILMDYGDIIAHVFRQDIREFYGIEKMWGDAPTIPSSEYDRLSTDVPPPLLSSKHTTVA